MRSLISILFGCALASAPVAYAFDVDGYRTGMSKEQVKAAADKYATVSAVDEDTLVANASNGTYSSFNFCKEKLVAVQQGYPASLKQVSLLVTEFNKLYGQPFSTESGARAHPTGEIHELGIWWRAGNEYVSIYYMGTPQSDSLSTSHQAKNACFKVPR